MIRIRVVNKTRESVLGAHVQLADRWWNRVRGFLGRAQPRGGEGLLLSPCRAVHMVGLGFPLDVIFLDREGAVVALYPTLRSGRLTRYHKRAEYALELPAGTIEATDTRPDDRIVWLPTEGAGEGFDPSPNGNGGRSGGRTA